MKNDFLLAITQLAAERNLPKDLVFKAVEAALISTYRKDDSFKKYDLAVSIFPANGEIKVYAQKTTVESPEDPWTEIALSDAKKLRKDVALGEIISIEIEPPDAGRVGVQTAKQVVMQRLREAEHEYIFGTFAHREGDILSGIVQRIEARHVIVDLGKADGLLPLSEQVRTEHYRVGQRLKVYLLEVSQTNKGPRLLISRTHPNLVRCLFDLEVPEIGSGIVEMKAVAREPGSRAKIAVAAKQEEIDPVGSCIGLRGIRIQNIINELQGEKVDVVQWQPDPKVFIANALSPAQVMNVMIDEEELTSVAVVPDGQLSLAIGREGQNVRLAAKLTGWKIDIKSVSEVREEGILPITEEGVVPAEEIAELIIEEEAVEEVEEAEEEAVEELVPIEAVIGKETVAAEGPQIRFAEDILPAAGRAGVGTGRARKDADDKPKGKKRTKRVRLPQDDDEIEVDDEDELY